MNTKIAKALRKIARKMAKTPLSYISKGNSRKIVVDLSEPKLNNAITKFIDDKSVTPEDVSIMKEPKFLTHPGTTYVHPESERGMYKMLKKAHRQQQAAK